VTETIEGQPGLCLAYLRETECEEKVKIPVWYPADRPEVEEKAPLPESEEKKVKIQLRFEPLKEIPFTGADSESRQFHFKGQSCSK